MQSWTKYKLASADSAFERRLVRVVIIIVIIIIVRIIVVVVALL
jgi:hypothetical protein